MRTRRGRRGHVCGTHGQPPLGHIRRQARELRARDARELRAAACC